MSDFEYVMVVAKDKPELSFYFWGDPVQDEGGIGGYVKEGDSLVWHQWPWTSVQEVVYYNMRLTEKEWADRA